MSETQTSPSDRLSYLVRGSGPALVLAHGAGGSTELNWGPLLYQLASEHTVVGVDLPGASDTPRSDTPLSLNALADGLVHAGVEAGHDSFTIVGFSTSCAIAIRAAVRHPDHVRALVLVSGFAHADAHLRIAADLWERLLDGPPRELGRFLCFIGLSPAALAGQEPDQLEQQFDFVGEKIAPGTRAHLDLLRRVDVREDLPRVAVPTLVVAGSEDYTVRPSNSHFLRERIIGAEFLELEAGHLVMAERPDELVAGLRRLHAAR